MPNWGYNISKDNQIDFDKNDRQVMQQLAEAEPSFNSCISCGSCAGTCSTSDFTTLSLRKINLLVLRGETDEVLSEISQCMLCGKCTLVCPRGVNTRNVILNLLRILQ